MKRKRAKRLSEPEQALVQYATIVWRRVDSGAIEVLLVTSRETGRWVIPKGWPMKARKPHEAAATEALEEAGVVGKTKTKPIGTFDYFKRRVDHFASVKVAVFLMEFKAQAASWREQGQRRLLWTSPENAADLVDETGLQHILLNLTQNLPKKKQKKKKQRPSADSLGAVAGN